MKNKKQKINICLKSPQKIIAIVLLQVALKL